ncbi:LITAF-like zinc ribbon domain-domain-containing protein [Absidia repens]|uniref:LITAF-like zinc ribbon domain-domain-containing protein n=1 Tax=Absidia repens TaxID=90262 RepID=A0A1X2INE3_9FUNG|nr:LITAF-like zinc ribbon domain-domain-containing protein [Absidia repens]
MDAVKDKAKGKILSSLFHTKKERASRYQADSGHDDGSNISPAISKKPSIVLSASSPILPKSKRGIKDGPSSSSSLTPSQQIQLLTVSSPSLSHEPSRTRSTSRLSSMSSLYTYNQSTSLRSAQSNDDDIDIHVNQEQAPSIIRSDRVHRYHFETPSYPSNDGASSRFSYNAIIHQNQLESSSSSTSSLKNDHNQHHHSSSHRHTPRFSLRRPHFSSSFNSFHRRRSLASHSSHHHHNRDSTNVSVASSTSRRVPRQHESIFLGRSLPDFETLVYCSACEKWIQSRLRYRSGAMVWLAAFVLLMCTVIFFWVPFYTKYFKDTIHYCPSCGCQVGRHNAL